MTRWDDREEVKSKSLNPLFFIAMLFLGIGFVIGAFWGLWYFTSLIEPITSSVMSFDDTILILSSKT